MMCGRQNWNVHIDHPGHARMKNQDLVMDGIRAPGMARIAVDGGELTTAIAGEGPTLILLHGWTLDHRMWRPQLPLADRYNLIMPDRRGFGASTAPPEPAQELTDIDCLAPSGRFSLVGLSQGATTALEYARKFPNRVAALVLAGAPLHGLVPQNPSAPEHLPRERFIEWVRSGALAAMKADWKTNPLVDVRPPARALVNAMLNDYDGRDLLKTSGGPRFTTEDIRELAMPVLALAGARDNGWRRDVATFIGETAQHGQSALIEDAGHLCNLDNPKQFNALLDIFLSENLGKG